MAVGRITKSRAGQIGVVSLSLDPTVLELSSTEALSELLRRVASFRCPTTQRDLLDVAVSMTRDFVDEPDLRDRLRELLREIVGTGDLLELPTPDGEGILVYLAVPSFVERGRDRFLLLGVRPHGAPLLEGEAMEDVEPEGHVRFLNLTGHPEPTAYLKDLGLRELGRGAWLKTPRAVEPQDFIAEFDSRLDAAAPGTMELAGAALLDPAARVTFYKGRWRAPSESDTGRFVGRRPQAYGSDLWIYAELQAGSFTRVIDLPVLQDLSRGADEAWRLQAAVDHLGGNPQRLRLEGKANDRSVLSVFSPLPSWAQRRLDMVGTPVPPRGGALMCYSIRQDEAPTEVAALRSLMWLKEID